MKLRPSSRPLCHRAGAATALFFATIAAGCSSPPGTGPSAPTSPGAPSATSTGSAAPSATSSGATAPTTTQVTPPTAAELFAKANVVRGGQLYDAWWKVGGVLDAAEPAGTNPDYARTKGKKTGAGTYRCKECHGWDYKGRDGAYASGKSFTGVAGLIRAQTAATPDEVYKVLRDGLADGSHKEYAAHLHPSDTWDLVKFIKEGVVDLTPLLAADTRKPLKADAKEGQTRYQTCSGCHGADGKAKNFGSADAPEYAGTIASNNPWEFVHKVRFGAPSKTAVAGWSVNSGPMPSAVQSGWTMQDVLNVLAHTQTLPVK